MAVNVAYHIPIGVVKTDSGNTPENQSIQEKNGQTFAYGVPVQLNGGYVQLWDGATYTAGFLGVAAEYAHNLATSGAGAPLPFGQIQGNMATQTYGTVINEPLAVNIAYGAPIVDGRILVYLANTDIIFEAQFDNAAGAVAADYTPTQAMMGSFFGLTADGNGTYYIDKSKATVGTNTCVQLIDINPVDGYIVNARVRFRFAKTSQQLLG